jgi:hypothetical protein
MVALSAGLDDLQRAQGTKSFRLRPDPVPDAFP